MRFEKFYSIRGFGGILRFENFFQEGAGGDFLRFEKPKCHTPVIGGGPKMAKKATADI